MTIDNALDSLKATTDDIDSGITGDKIEMIELEIQDIKASFEKEKNRIKAEFDNIVQSKLDSDVYNTLQIGKNFQNYFHLNYNYRTGI